MKKLVLALCLSIAVSNANGQSITPSGGGGGGSATVNGQACAPGSSCVVTAPPSYLSGNWFSQYNINNQIAGSATTASTIYCSYTVVQQPVTIKALGVYLVTGILTDTAQLAIYSHSGGTLTLVDSTANISTGVGQTGTAINGTLGNTTDILQPNVLYAFCENGNGAMVFSSAGASFPGQGQLIGSATQGNVNGVAALLNGRSIAQTYGTWPGTITESSMADVTSTIVPVFAYRVN